jgi:hypothetical protein
MSAVKLYLRSKLFLVIALVGSVIVFFLLSNHMQPRPIAWQQLTDFQPSSDVGVKNATEAKAYPVSHIELILESVSSF